MRGAPADRLRAGGRAKTAPCWFLAAERFFAHAARDERARYERFIAEERAWLDDWALFAVLKAENDGPPLVALAQAPGLARARRPGRLRRAAGHRAGPRTLFAVPFLRATAGLARARQKRRDRPDRRFAHLLRPRQRRRLGAPYRLPLGRRGRTYGSLRRAARLFRRRWPSFGARPFTIGSAWPKTATPSGWTVCAAPCAKPMSCGSTTSGPSPIIGRFRRAPKRRGTAAGGAGRAMPSSPSCAKSWATRRSSPRIWASLRGGWKPCATAGNCRG